MDTVTAAVIVVAILAVVALVAIIMYRERLKLSMGANKLEFDGSNSPSEPVSSPAQATPAGGARVSDVEAGKNISARVEVLRRLPSTVTVATEPPGSTIELASDAGRQALGSDGQALQVVAGTYELTVQRPGYEPRTRSMHEILGIEGANDYQVIKQPDVLMVQYLLHDHYSDDVIRANYNYYNARTDHTYGSSLGPSIQAIIAGLVGEPLSP